MWKRAFCWLLFYPLRPSGTSPKYDKLKSECGFKVYIVVFGGGWVGAEVDGDIHDLQQEEDAKREKAPRSLRKFGNKPRKLNTPERYEPCYIGYSRIKLLAGGKQR